MSDRSIDVRPNSHVIRTSEGEWATRHSITGLGEATTRARQFSANHPEIRVHIFRVDDRCVPHWVTTFVNGELWTGPQAARSAAAA
jgi:hypothetical protein